MIDTVDEPNTPQRTDEPTRKPVSIVLIGCGDFGSYMADIISAMPEFCIDAVCDSSEERASRVGTKLGAAVFTSTSDCLLRSASEAVALFTPNHLHHQQTIAAAASGKHIFCEKPMALNVEQCYGMIESAEKANVHLMIGHKRRLRPQYLKIADVVQSGSLGRPLSVTINGFFGRPAASWWCSEALGGGLLPYAGVHDIDFLRSICGEVATVSARVPIKTDFHTDYEDAISVLLQFESGVAATLEVCPLYPLQTFRQAFGVQIVFERGGLWYNPHTCTVRIYRNDGHEEVCAFDNDAGFLHAYKAELTSFARWVRSGEPPVLTAWDGLRCVEVMEAAKISAYRGVEVPLPLPRSSLPPKRSSGFRYAKGLAMPEGPVFDREGNLYVANCRADFVSRISPEGRVIRFVTTGGKTQGVAIHPDGRLFVTDWKTRKIYVATPDGHLSIYCDRYSDGSQLRGPNEISFGPNGQLYFTDPGDAWRGVPKGALSRITPTGVAEMLAAGFEFTNGLDFEPNGQMIYFADTTRPGIFHAPLDHDGALVSAPIEFVTFPSTQRPDGIRFASNGDLYVTLFGAGKVVVVHPNGTIEDYLTLPGLFPTNLAFRNNSTFVCEGQTGSVWRFDDGIEGFPSYAERTWNSHCSFKPAEFHHLDL